MSLNKRERLEKTFAGESTDRPPVALWRHWPGDDQRPADLVESALQFQRQYDWDFLKLTPASSYAIADYGVQDRWAGSIEGTREYTRRAIERSMNWTELRTLDPSKGALGRSIEALRMLEAAIEDDTPILMTIFSPLAQAKNLVGRGELVSHLRTAPERFRAGLTTLTESTLRFMDAIRRMKIAGIFYAIQHANYAIMSEAEYREFGRPFDLQILRALPGDWWFNMLHLHGDAPMFDLIADYPVQAINWHDRETEPDIVQGKARFPGAVCGGLGRFDPVHNGTPGEVRAMARDAIERTGGRRFILSTGCVMMITSPLSNVRAVRIVVNAPGQAG